MKTYNDAVLVTDVVRRTDGKSVEYSAVICGGHNGGYCIRHSHATIALEGAGPWFGDSLAWAPDFESAMLIVRSQIRRIATAFAVTTW